MTSETIHAKADMAELRANLDKLTEDVAKISHSMASVIKSSAGRAANNVSDGVRTAVEEIKEKGKDSKDAIENTIQERPFQSLLVAFGAGLLIAQLFRKHG